MTSKTILGMIDACGMELLLFCAVWILIGAIDDVATDLYFAAYRIRRWFVRYRRTARMRSTELPPPQHPGQIAVFVAAWQEAGIVGDMLAGCTRAWKDESYRLYVGCYGNDADTVAEVVRAAAANPAIRVVLNTRRGPTTKADCLNRLWRALLQDERAQKFRAKAIALHDAEDLVHSDEIRIFDTLIERKALIQLPVLPLRVEGSHWVSGHYCDEFAESHTKQMVVREALGVGLPSSGVGCAFSRDMLEKIALHYPDGPFDATSLTEDYELGLKISQHGGQGMMVRMRDANGQVVGTRAFFPATLQDAVRQKSRWITGIALAGWDRMGWTGSWREIWMRLHDRRGIFSALVLFAAYLALMLEGLVMASATLGLYEPQPLGPLLSILLPVNALLLCWRLAMRAFFVGRLYGIREALRSIPRSVVSNIIAILAARRAVFAYTRHWLGHPLRWEKTRHIAPPKEGWMLNGA